MTSLTRQQRRAQERKAKKQGCNTVVTPDIDPFSLPMLNEHNIAVFRSQHGVNTHDDIQRVIETRALLVAAHDALQQPPLDHGDYGETLDGMEAAIETLDAVISPTEEALSDYFVENWAFYVIDGECHVRYQPLTEADWRAIQEEAE